MAKSGGFGSMAESLAPLALRVPLGIVFIAHGAQKLFGVFGGDGLTKTLSTFEHGMGIPPILTLLAILAEFGGGIGLLIGFLTRFAALGIAIDMAVAVYKVHWANGFFLNATCHPGKGHGFEYNLVIIGMALSLLLTGGGRWAADRLVWRR